MPLNKRSMGHGKKNSAANSYTTSGTLGGDDILTGSLNDGQEWAADLSALSGVDEKVKVSADDTTANFLLSKIVAGSNITLTETDPGGNETITIDSVGGGGGGTTNWISGSSGSLYHPNPVGIGIGMTSGAAINYPLSIRTNDSTSARPSANVAVYIKNSANSGPAPAIEFTNDNGATTMMQMGINLTSHSFRPDWGYIWGYDNTSGMRFGTENTERMIISGANIGIGDFVGKTGPPAQLSINYSGMNAPAFQIYSGATTAFVVSGGSAKVGIGTDSPTQVLDVRGTTLLSGNTVISGTLNVTTAIDNDYVASSSKWNDTYDWFTTSSSAITIALASGANYSQAYNDYITGVAYSTPTLTLTQRDGGTLTASIPGGAKEGTVTSVAISGNDGIDVTGSPITSAGTIQLGLSNINANKIADGSVSSTEFQYLDGLSEDIQTSLDGKQPLDSELTTLAGLTEARGSLIVGNSTPAWSALTIGSANKVLYSDGTDAAWTETPTINLVSGSGYLGDTNLVTVGAVTEGTWQADVVTEAYGGTGFVSYAVGDMLYADAATSFKKLVVNQESQVLTLKPSGAYLIPSWESPVSGTVTFKDGEFIKDPEGKINTSFTVGSSSCYYVSAGRDTMDYTVTITFPSSGITDGAKYDLLCISEGITGDPPGFINYRGTINVSGNINGASQVIQINTAIGTGSGAPATSVKAYNIVTAHWSTNAATWFVSKPSMI